MGLCGSNIPGNYPSRLSCSPGGPTAPPVQTERCGIPTLIDTNKVAQGQIRASLEARRSTSGWMIIKANALMSQLPVLTRPGDDCFLAGASQGGTHRVF